jgi:hypothetical protein
LDDHIASIFNSEEYAKKKIIKQGGKSLLSPDYTGISPRRQNSS